VKIVSENAFRILGLPVTASDQDIARREEELEAYVAIGQFPTFSTDFPWIGNLGRSEESIRHAIQQLDNPSLKLEHTLFWFWECTADDISAIEALREGNVEQATIIWNEAVDTFGLTYEGITHLKNLTVLSLIQSFQGSAFDHRKFIASIENWGRALSSEFLMKRLTLLRPDLKGAIDNDRLADIVGRILYSSSKGFLSQWIKDDDYEKPTEYFRAFSKGGFSQTLQCRITSDITTPISKRIDDLCEEAVAEQFSDMDTLPTAIHSFCDDMYPLLNRLENLLPPSDPALEHYRDKVGQIVRDKAIEYGNNTKDWTKAKELCEYARSIAIGPALKKQLNEDLEIVNQNVNYERIYGKLLPIDHAPGLGTFNTIGTMLHGSSNFDINTSSYETTQYFVVLFIPLFPLSRYRVIKEGDRYRFLGKLPFRQTEKWHLGLFLFSVALFLIFLISTGGDSNRYDNHSEVTQPYSSTPSNLPLNNSPSDETNPRTDETKREISSLESDIKADREQLRAYESELQRNRSLLNSYDARLKNLKNQLEDAESKSQRGQYFDESVYQFNLDAYNSLVVKYNTEFDKDRQLYDRYEKLLSATNEKIDRYNRLIGAK